MDDVAVVIGGIIPEADIPGLKAAGIAGIFPPGTSTQEIVEFVRAHARARNRPNDVGRRACGLLRRTRARPTNRPRAEETVASLAIPVIETRVHRDSPEFAKNSRRMIDLLTEIKNEEAKLHEGGGARGIEAQHKKGRLTVRERIARLIDPKSPFFELGLYAAYEMYEEWGGAPAAGTVTGLARVAGRLVMIIANDATVKAGAFFPMTAKKVIRAQNIAHRESHSDDLPGGLGRRVSALAGRCFSRTRMILAACFATTR